MNKKINSAFLTLFIVGLFSLFTANIFAQATDSLETKQKTKTCLGKKFVMPQTISVGNDAFENYLRTASLPRAERIKSFDKLSNEQKASFIKVNLALQFIKRPSMTKDQQEFVFDTISKVSADTYNKSDPEKIQRSEQSRSEVVNRALGLFTLKDAGDFIEPLMTNKDEEIVLLRKYVDLLKNGMKSRMKLTIEMPVNDRVNIWKTQLAYHLVTGKFSDTQKRFILEMLTSLSPETLVPSANLTDEEKSKVNVKLEASIFNVFTNEEGYAIFMAVGIQSYVSQEYIPEGNTCDCNFYCSGSEICDQPDGCRSSSTGCGPFGGSSCHYRCS